MRSFVLTTLLIAGAAGSASAQGVNARTTPVPELLSTFVAEQSVRNGPRPARDVIHNILFGHVIRPPGDIDALISGLDSIARNGPSSVVKARAAGMVIMAGTEGPDNAPRHPRAAPVVLALFEDVEDYVVRGTILGVLPQLADRSVTVRIVRRVLTEEAPAYVRDDMGMQARRAVGAALSSGPPGLALLRELHAAGTIRDGSARAMVEELRASGRLRGGGLE